MRTSIIGLLAISLLVSARDHATAKCARVLHEPEVLTHGADVIPGGGGVLVGYKRSTAWDGAYDYNIDPAMRTEWRFVLRKKKVKPTIEQLAPGLAVYRPGTIKAVRAEKLALQDGKGKRVGSFSAKRGKVVFNAGAPAVKSITETVTTSGRWGDDHNVDVVLDATPPAGAVALILYRVDSKTSTPISWVNVKGSTATTVRVYESDAHCGSNPSGMTHPGVGTTVTLAWVDQFGRLSPTSAGLKVAKP